MSRIITLAALALATSATFAIAGGPIVVGVEPTVIVAAGPTGGLNAGIVVGGLLLIALAVGLSGSDATTTPDTILP